MKRFAIQLVFLSFFFSFNPFRYASSVIFAQNWDWSIQIGGIGVDACEEIAVSSDGSIYFAGNFENTLEIESWSLESHGSKDAFLMKLNPEGIFQWAVKAGGDLKDETAAIACDEEGNTYWVGLFWLEAFFDTLSLISEMSSKSIFVAKYNSEGTLLWVKKIEGNGFAKKVTDIKAKNGFIYLTGYFGDKLYVGDTTLVAEAHEDMFVAKLNSEGHTIWAARGGIEGDINARSLALDTENNVIIGGHYFGEVVFGTDTLTASTFDPDDTDVFIAKYNPDGIALWGKKAGSVHRDQNSDISVDESGNIYLCGTFVGVIKLSEELSIQTQGFNENFYLLKYGNDGTPLWGKSLGGTKAEHAEAMHLTSSSVLVTGHFYENSDVDGIAISGSAGFYSGYIASFSHDGNTQWGIPLIGEENVLGTGVVADPSGGLITIANFQSTATIGENTLYTNGQYDG
ncbi:MAG: hypothetical protein GY705_01625, partial [Bacteroidetes bacterium]|nr:hypothetical protein [Bacteroidota bacterium]